MVSGPRCYDILLRDLDQTFLSVEMKFLFLFLFFFFLWLFILIVGGKVAVNQAFIQRERLEERDTERGRCVKGRSMIERREGKTSERSISGKVLGPAAKK